jgi:3-hydroxybutyryl-CoA dehydrogenase
MNLLIIGNDAALAECKARLGDGHQYFHVKSLSNGNEWLKQAHVVFDFSEGHSSESIEHYITQSNAVIFINTVFTTLSKVLDRRSIETTIIGFCGLPTFFNREVLEVSLVDEKHREKLNIVSQSLGLKYMVVKDQVGFVTPRVVCMIINEAYDALKNGVASRADIDLSMKLGTNYPFGPFEWSERIGVDNVRKLLASIEKATDDARYRPMF